MSIFQKIRRGRVNSNLFSEKIKLNKKAQTGRYFVQPNQGGGDGTGSGGGFKENFRVNRHIGEGGIGQILAFAIAAITHFAFIFGRVDDWFYWFVCFIVVLICSLTIYRNGNSLLSNVVNHLAWFIAAPLIGLSIIHLILGFVGNIPFFHDPTVVLEFLLTWFPFVPFLYFYRYSKGKMFKLLEAYLIVILIFVLVAIFTNSAIREVLVENSYWSTSVAEDGIETGTNLIRTAGAGVIDVFRGFIPAILDPIIEPLDITLNILRDPYYHGRVEESKDDEALGVYIENLEGISEYFFPNEVITVFGNIRGKTFVGEVEIENSCQGTITNIQREKITIEGKITPDRKIPIYDSHDAQITCDIDLRDVELELRNDESMKVEFISKFNFVTWGDTTYTFIDKEILRSFNKPKDEVADDLGIEPRLEATYTNGPVTLGLVDRQAAPQMPYSIDSNDPILPFFGVTIENNNYYENRGSIQRIRKMTFLLPEPLELEKSTCRPVAYDRFEKDTERGLNKYTFDFIDYQLNPASSYHTFRCQMVVSAGDVSELLGESGVALTTLIVELDYEYELKEDKRVTIRAMQDVNG